VELAVCNDTHASCMVFAGSQGARSFRSCRMGGMKVLTRRTTTVVRGASCFRTLPFASLASWLLRCALRKCHKICGKFFGRSGLVRCS
jgi:hypothetical protein